MRHLRSLDTMILLPPEVRTALFRLHTLLQEDQPSAWLALVGGTARDLLRGEIPTDLDLAAGGIPEKSLALLLRQYYPGKVRRVGKAHPILKLKTLPGWDIDLVWESEQAFSEELWRELCQRRDFTVNSMALLLPHEDLFDPCKGQSDLKKELLRATGPDTISQDPLRVYRAAQLVARLGYVVEPKTESAIRRVVDSGALETLPAERLTQEWKGLLLRPHQPSLGLEMLRQLGVFERAYPEFVRLWSTPQDLVHHPEGDVWVHTGLVVDQAARLVREAEPPFTPSEAETVMFGALCHDLGKPYTTVVNEGRVTAYGHEAAGVVPAAHWLSRLSLSNEVVRGVLTCVEQHMRPSSLARCIDAGELSARQQFNVTRRLTRDVSAAGWRVFLTVCEADKRGRGFADAATAPYRPAELLNPILQTDPHSSEPLIRGRDLLEMGYSAGRALGPLLKQVEKARDEGLIATRDEALAWVQANLPLKPRSGKVKPAGVLPADSAAPSSLEP
jgi:tRNA nucleotidyltransferase (CCA-adding enzyme)